MCPYEKSLKTYRMHLVYVYCIQWRVVTMFLYKNIICFISFHFITRNLRVGRVSQSWDAHTEGQWCSFSVESLYLSVLWCLGQNLHYIIFQMPIQSSWSPCFICWTGTHLLSSMTSTQFTRQKYLHSVYFRKQMIILLYQKCNSRRIFL